MRIETRERGYEAEKKWNKRNVSGFEQRNTVNFNGLGIDTKRQGKAFTPRIRSPTKIHTESIPSGYD